MLSFMCGVASSGGHGVVAVGRFEFWEAWKDEAMKKTLIKSQGANLKQNLRSVLALSMLEILPLLGYRSSNVWILSAPWWSSLCSSSGSWRW